MPSCGETWICPKCTYGNRPRRKRCEICEARRPLDETSNSSNDHIALPVQKKKKASPSKVSQWLDKRKKKRKRTVTENEESEKPPEKYAKVRIRVSDETLGSTMARLPANFGGLRTTISSGIERTETKDIDIAHLSKVETPELSASPEQFLDESTSSAQQIPRSPLEKNFGAASPRPSESPSQRSERAQRENPNDCTEAVVSDSRSSKEDLKDSRILPAQSLDSSSSKSSACTGVQGPQPMPPHQADPLSDSIPDEQHQPVTNEVATAECAAAGLSEVDTNDREGSSLQSSESVDVAERPPPLSQGFGFSHMMTQQAGDFLYTQMSQYDEENQQNQFGTSQDSEKSLNVIDRNSQAGAKETTRSRSVKLNESTEHLLGEHNVDALKAESLHSSSAPNEVGRLDLLVINTREIAVDGRACGDAQSHDSSKLPTNPTESCVDVDNCCSETVCERSQTSLHQQVLMEGSAEKPPSRATLRETQTDPVREKRVDMSEEDASKEKHAREKTGSAPGCVTLTTIAATTSNLHSSTIRHLPQTAMQNNPNKLETRKGSENGSLDTNKPHIPLAFQTAGKHKRISVSHLSFARAEQLLESPPFKGADVHHEEGTILSGNPTLLSDVTQTSTHAVFFKTVGRQTRIAASMDSKAKKEQMLASCCAASDSIMLPQHTPCAAKDGNHSKQLAQAFRTVDTHATKSKVATSPAHSNGEPDERQSDGLETGKSSTRTTSNSCSGNDEAHNELSSRPVFMTAGKKTEIMVSSESMANAETLLDRLCSSVETVAPLVFADKTSKRTVQPTPMFQTAGKHTTIEVSAERLSKAKHILEKPSLSKGNFCEGARTATTDRASQNIAQHRLSSQSAMFKTAGKRRGITVSSENMAKADQILAMPSSAADPAYALGSSLHSVHSNRRTIHQPPFQNAAVEHTVIANTSESLIKSPSVSDGPSSLFDDNKTSHNDARERFPPQKVFFESPGKQDDNTGSSESRNTNAEKPSSIMEAAVTLQAVLRAPGEQAVQLPPFFQTAGNKKTIRVSKESLAKANDLFARPSSDSKDNLPNTCSTLSTEVSHAAIFTTAGKQKRILAWPDSIAKAERLLGTMPPETDHAAAGGSLHGIHTGMQTARSIPSLQPDCKRKTTTVSAVSVEKSSNLSGPVGGALIEGRFQRGNERSAADRMIQPKSFPRSSSQGLITSARMETARDSSLAMDPTAAVDSPVGNSHPTSEAAQFTACFQTAGKRSTINVSAESLTRANQLISDLSTIRDTSRGGKKESDASSNSVSETSFFKKDLQPRITNSSRYTGEAVEREEQPSSTDDPEAVDDCGLRVIGSSKESNQLPCFHTAGKQNLIPVSMESLDRANRMLETPSSPGGIVPSEQDCSSAAHIARKAAPSLSFPSAPVPVFKTAGKQTEIALSAEIMATAEKIMEFPSSVTDSPDADGVQTGKQTANQSRKFQVARRENPQSVAVESPRTQKQAVRAASSIYDGVPGGSDISVAAPSHSSPPAAIFKSVGKNEEATVSLDSLTKVEHMLAGTVNPTTVTDDGNLYSLRISNQPFQPPPFLQTACKENAATASMGGPYNAEDVDEPSASSLPSDHPTVDDAPVPDACDDKDTVDQKVSEVTSVVNDDNALPLQERSTINPAISGDGGGPQMLLSKEKRLVACVQTSQSRITSPSACDTAMSHDFDLMEGTEVVEDKVCSQSQSIPIGASGLSTEERPSVSQSFTPLPPPISPKTMVTLSTSVKNPYNRRRSSNVGEGEDGTVSFSAAPVTPIPFNFNHVDGRFRGEDVSPSSPSNSEPTPETDVCEEETASRKIVMTASPNGYTNNKKAVKWTLGENAWPRKLTLSQYAAHYGKMTDDIADCRRYGVEPATIEVDSMNATELRFDSNTGLPCGFSGDDTFTKQRFIGSSKELFNALIGTGCDQKTITERWILNHTRWIVWKLASIERRFPKHLACRYLSYSHLVSQLRQRYEKEIRGGKRSSLRKVLNRDVAPNCSMVLCVSKVIRPGDTNRPQFSETRVELTDGWYGIQASLDTQLAAFVRKGTIRMGSKLLICNASMTGAEEGTDPLDPSYSSAGLECSALLGLTVNATRPARWDAKLGFVSPSIKVRSQHGLLLVRSISHIIPGGGCVPLIDLIVCRKYPRLFLEKQGKSSGRKSVVLTTTQEDSARKEYEKRRQRHVEQISERVHKECKTEIDEESPQLWKRLLKSSSPTEFYERLTATEKTTIDKWKEQRDALLQDRVHKEVEAEMECENSLLRESTPFVRVLVKAFDAGAKFSAQSQEEKTTDTLENESAIITVWHESEEQQGVLKEGNVVRVRNLSVRPTKRDGMIQLTAGRKTPMETLAMHVSSSTLALMGFKRRRFLSLFGVQLLSKKLFREIIPSFPNPEVDTAGIVIKLIEKDYGTGVRFQIYITDESGLVLRVECDEDSIRNESLLSLSTLAHQNVEKSVVVSFHDIRILSFDPLEKCAVAVIAETSSLKVACGRISDLRNWSKSSDGKRMLSRLAAYIDAGVPMLKDLMSPTPTAIGYIAGFSVSSECSQPLELDMSHLVVDCGLAELEVWEFPLALLDDALRLVGESNATVAVNLEEEPIHLRLKHLGRMFRASGVLVHFVLRQLPHMQENDGNCGASDCAYQVQQLRKANPHALAGIYTSSHTGN